MKNLQWESNHAIGIDKTHVYVYVDNKNAANCQTLSINDFLIIIYFFSNVINPEVSAFIPFHRGVIEGQAQVLLNSSYGNTNCMH